VSFPHPDGRSKIKQSASASLCYYSIPETCSFPEATIRCLCSGSRGESHCFIWLSSSVITVSVLLFRVMDIRYPPSALTEPNHCVFVVRFIVRFWMIGFAVDAVPQCLYRNSGGPNGFMNFLELAKGKGNLA